MDMIKQKQAIFSQKGYLLTLLYFTSFKPQL